MNEITAKNVIEKSVKKFFIHPKSTTNPLRIYLEQEVAKLGFMQRKETMKGLKQITEFFS